MEIIFLVIGFFVSILLVVLYIFLLRWVLGITTIIKNQEQANKYLKELSEQNNEILRKLRQ